MLENRVHRNSPQREVILEELRKVNSHPTAASLFKLVSKRLPNISLGTVYRNLHQLVEHKVVQEIFWGKEEMRYEYGIEEHPHFKCTKCKNLINIDMPVTSMIIRGIEKNEGHVVEDMQLMIWGICKDCNSKEN